MKTFLINTLGCKVNAYESQAVKEILLKNGYIERNDKDPDVVIINTCAVTKMAEHKSRQKVSSLAKKYPSSIIVVCGCSSQLHPNSYSQIEGVDIVIGNNNHLEIMTLLEKYNKEHKQQISLDDSTRKRTYQNIKITSFDEKVRAFVKIGDGCDNFCAYCIIPFTRGKLRSRPREEILDEIKALIKNDYKEIVLTGIDSASYGREFDDYKFDDLLEDILKIEGLKRLRISSIEASQITDRFISLMKNNKIVAPHLHIPLQSGSDTVLKRMRRKYTCDEFYKTILKIKTELPDVALACDVIVGFPGESEEEFIETYQFIEKCGFAFLHVFPYSIREGTLAASMKNQIPSAIKKQRVASLIQLGNRLSNEYALKFVGKELEVLVESYDEASGLYKGYSENYLDCYLTSENNVVNQIVKINYFIK